MDRILSVGNKIELSKIKKNKDDDAVTYVSQILDMKDEKIVAAMPISEGHIVPIEPGSRMHAYFYTVKGIFSCEILVTERGKEGNIYIMAVSYTHLYNVIPIGQVKFSASIYNDIIGFMSDYFVIGFRIALPVFSAILLLNVILAILARIAPQMNMFVVGMQLKIFVGIFAVFFTIVMMPAVSTFIEDEIKTLMASLVRGMSP